MAAAGRLVEAATRTDLAVGPAASALAQAARALHARAGGVGEVAHVLDPRPGARERRPGQGR